MGGPARFLGHQVFRLLAFVPNTLENDIDLGGFETDQAHIETNISQMLQFDREHLIVIARLFREAIVRKNVSTLTPMRKMRSRSLRR